VIIFGDKDIEYGKLYFVASIEDIKNTPPNSIIYHTYDIKLIKYAKNNQIQNAINITTITEAIFCNALAVDFIIVDKNIAKQIQNIAQNYMFDSKILQTINSIDDIQDVALDEIDGCIYKNILKG
jgi:hypothetical protein